MGVGEGILARNTSLKASTASLSLKVMIVHYGRAMELLASLCSATVSQLLCMHNVVIESQISVKFSAIRLSFGALCCSQS